MKTKIIILSIISIISLSFIIGQEEINWNSCMKKYNSNWGKACPDCIYNEDIFHVYMRNVSQETVDVLIAVQEKNKTWRCSYNEKINPNDTIEGFACKGTGKYLFWVRKAGDRELEFPTCEQVNTQYKE
jgi:hypothetical protein